MNIQNRVNDLLEKDEIEKQRQLREVEDFYRDIEEDLMVVCLYNVHKNGHMTIHKAFRDYFIHENISQILVYMLEINSKDVYKDNLEFVEKFNDIQLLKFYEIMVISLKNNGMKIKKISSQYCSLDDFFRIDKIDDIEIKEDDIEEISTVEETDKKFKLNIPLTCLLFLIIVILLIIVFLPVK